jgi:hypothetical protein
MGKNLWNLKARKDQGKPEMKVSLKDNPQPYYEEELGSQTLWTLWQPCSQLQGMNLTWENNGTVERHIWWREIIPGAFMSLLPGVMEASCYRFLAPVMPTLLFYWVPWRTWGPAKFGLGSLSCLNQWFSAKQSAGKFGNSSCPHCSDIHTEHRITRTTPSGPQPGICSNIPRRF